MKLTIADIREHQGRAYARALVDAERLRTMAVVDYASEADFVDTEREVVYRYNPSNPSWVEHGQGYERRLSRDEERARGLPDLSTDAREAARARGWL